MDLQICSAISTTRTYVFNPGNQLLQDDVAVFTATRIFSTCIILIIVCCRDDPRKGVVLVDEMVSRGLSRVTARANSRLRLLETSARLKDLGIWRCFSIHDCYRYCSPEKLTDYQTLARRVYTNGSGFFSHHPSICDEHPGPLGDITRNSASYGDRRNVC